MDKNRRPRVYMTKEARCKNIRNSLFSAITKVASVPDDCVRNPGIDFTRNRKLPLSAMLLMLIGMGGGILTPGGSSYGLRHDQFTAVRHVYNSICIEKSDQRRNNCGEGVLFLLPQSFHFLNKVLCCRGMRYVTV